MDIFTAVVLVLTVSYIMVRISNATDREHRENIVREFERRRQKRIDALYGRGEDEDS